MNNHSREGFTLFEILMVVIIISITATIALPNYNSVIQRGIESNAMTQLRVIHAAQQIYFTQNNDVYWIPNGTDDIAEINADLNLSIVFPQVEFDCDATNVTFSCTAYYPDIANEVWSLNVDQLSLAANNPCCINGPCPTAGVC